jgi:hypothetical protein
MKSSLDIVDILWHHLDSSSLKAEINGIVCKKRPINSKGEDVVVNALAANNLDPLQSAVINVNIYVPNKTQHIGTSQDSTQPDFARLKQLTGMAVVVLNDQWSVDYNFSVQQTVGPFEDEGDQHYVNIRVEFFSINILN